MDKLHMDTPHMDTPHVDTLHMDTPLMETPVALVVASIEGFNAEQVYYFNYYASCSSLLLVSITM